MKYLATSYICEKPDGVAATQVVDYSRQGVLW